MLYKGYSWYSFLHLEDFHAFILNNFNKKHNSFTTDQLNKNLIYNSPVLKTDKIIHFIATTVTMPHSSF